MSIISWNCRGLGNLSAVPKFKFLLREGRGGGLALLWRSSLHCNITNFSSNHIDIEITDTHRGSWRLTGFYGYPGKQAVLDAGLSDVHMEGYPFTWFKSLGTPRAVEERLDRALANEDWFHMFPNAKLENLVAPASDHYPILLDRDPIVRLGRPHHKFKFENAWRLESELDEVVHRCWNNYSDKLIMPRLEACAEELSLWSRNHCHNLKKEIEECRKKLLQVREQGGENNANYVGALQKRMTHLLVQDDMFWRQRAKTHWYKDGDLNTRFFHASATSRKKVNRISFLEDANGLRITDNPGMCLVAKDYFNELFHKQNSVRDPVISVISTTILESDNEQLTAPFTKEEFKEALFSMQSDKCP
ncbi:endonuclease/exonuclease/phosphatase family protein, partial [Trifolium pratense]